MNILHINSGQEGGAAWCARRINAALVEQCVDSRMLFADGESMPDGVRGAIAVRDEYIWDRSWFLKNLRHLLNRIPWVNDADSMQYRLNLANEHLTQQLYLHHPCSHFTNIANHPLVEWADIIHLHWVPDFVDYPSFFKEVKKPIVWTLHDKFPAVGLQHYCSAFSPVPAAIKSLDQKCRRVKRSGVNKSKNLNIVAISGEMFDIVNSSSVLKGLPVSLIHNGVNTELFMPKQNVVLYPELLSVHKVFLFAAYDVWDKNKGLHRVIEALEKLSLNDIALIVVGINDGEPHPQTSFPIFYTGLIKDQSKMAELYSMADYFISASYEESFGQVILEAMSCGVPVISTNCGIAIDIINPINGVVCDGYDSDSIAKGIQKALDATYNSAEIRQYIIKNFDYSIIASQYIQLYESILNNTR